MNFLKIKKSIGKKINFEGIKYFYLNILFLSLIIASKFRPLPILEKLLNYMSSNRYFVIYSLIQEVFILFKLILKLKFLKN